MMRCTQPLILFLALLLTNCMATPTSPVRTSETMTTVTLAVTATPRPAPTTTAAMTVPAAVTMAATATVTATAGPTLTPNATATRPPTHQPSPEPPAATAIATAAPEAPMVVLTANANLRAGPGTAYPVIGGGQTGQTLVVTGRANGSVDGLPVTWWHTSEGWVAGSLVTANAAAQTVALMTEVPATPEGKVKAKAKTAPTSTLASTSASSLPDRVVLGPDTQYPVRARVIRGWDYEFMDLSTQYDIVVYRDVFGMLAHQIDDDNVQRYKRPSRFAEYGPLRITLIDAQPHPDPNCPGWGWAPDRDTFVDPYGQTRNPCPRGAQPLPAGGRRWHDPAAGLGLPCRYDNGGRRGRAVPGRHQRHAPGRATPPAGSDRPGRPAGLRGVAVSAARSSAPRGQPLGLE